MAGYKLDTIVSKQHDGKVLREFILAELHISRTLLTDIKFKGGKIKVNGEEMTVRAVLREGDLVLIEFPREVRSEGMIPENIPLSIVYEDNDILIIDKTPGLPSIPSREHPNGTLANGLLHHYDEIGLGSTIHIINRLDRDTSGLMLVAKHRYVHHLFSMMQRRGEIERRYQAVVHGIVEQNRGVIDAPIGRKSDSIIEREVREDGQYAKTHYEVLRRFTTDDMTLVKLKLDTGRTHQIRVHLAHVGHPLLGDDLYGGSQDKMKRQALHSYELTFFHPIKNRTYRFEAGLPADMKAVLGEK